MKQIASERRGFRHKACAYCRAKPAGSVDHVPPACFFPRPLPADLITVPCCKACNARHSLDDLYVRDVLVLRADVATQPGLEPLVRALLDGSSSGSGLSVAQRIARNLHRRDVKRVSGIWIPDQYVYSVERKRFLKWLERLFRGLYWHEHREPLSPDLAVTAGFGEQFPEYVSRCVSWFRARPLVQRGPRVFEYKWMPIPDKPSASIWCAEFYRCVPVLGIIHPPNPQGLRG